MMTLKEYADRCKVTYETVRRKVTSNTEYLGEHLITQNGVRYLDDEGVAIMDALNNRKVDESEELAAVVRKDAEITTENTELLRKVNEVYEKLLKKQAEIIKLIEQQNETKQKLFEAEARVEIMEKEYQAKVMLLEMQKDPETIARQQEQIEQLKNDVGAYQDQAAYYKREAEEAQQRTEAMSRDADEAMHERDEQKRQNDQLAEILAAERQRREELEQEVNSFERSIFGLFKKKKK